MPYLADNSYLAIKPEATAGTAVIPDTFVPLVSESMNTTVNHEADRRMKGLDWKSDDLLRGNRTHGGNVTVLGDADVLAHFINMVMKKGDTTGDATDGYTHPFTVDDPKTYTIEIKKGLYAQRFFGVLVNTLGLSFDNGRLQISADIMAQGQFSVASVGLALTGAGMTSLTLDDEYDIAPNRGLVVGDKIAVGGVELTLTSVDANGRDVGFASTTVTAALGAPVYLVPQTVSMPAFKEPLFIGNALVGLGADSAAADTAAASRATATEVFDLTITLNNNLVAQNGTSRIDPFTIMTGSKEAQITLNHLFEDVSQRQAFLDRVKQAMTIIITGKNINPDFSTSEKLTLKFHNIKLMANDNAINVGSHIVDAQNFEVLYNSADGKTIEAEVVNETAGTAY
jgi:hypothetical protein